MRHPVSTRGWLDGHRGTAAGWIAGTAIAALATIACAAQSAEIYKCVDGARTVYQDQPCPSSAKASIVAPPEPRGAVAPPATAEERDARLRSQIDEMARQRRKREIAGEIARLETSIASLRQSEDAELGALRDKKGFNHHNLAAASWQREAVLRGIDAEMQAVTDKYRGLRDNVTGRIAQLRKDLAILDNPR